MKPTDPRENTPPGRLHVTVVESVEEIRARVADADTVWEEAPPAETAATTAEQTVPFRPAERPPMAILTVLDDGETSGEKVRVRSSTFVIGRVEGNLIIPHDNGMSARHAELSRRLEGGSYRWFLRDLGSTNGTFVRAANVLLQADQELLIGGSRLRVEVGGNEPAPKPGRGAGPSGARSWSK